MLRERVIKLATERPEYRIHLVPLLREAGVSDVLKNLWQQYKKKHPGSEKPPQSLIDKAKGDSSKKDSPGKKEPPKREGSQQRP